MNARHLAAAALTVAALAGTAGPASATCYVANVDICHKPTDPYTDPVFRVVDGVADQPVLDPAWGVVGTASQAYADVYRTAICLTGDYYGC
jgi:hypothetical protein